MATEPTCPICGTSGSPTCFPDEHVRIEMEGPPITRCQSRYAWNTWCVKPPHGPDDPWHTNGGAIHWHTDAEVQGTGEVVTYEGEVDW